MPDRFKSIGSFIIALSIVCLAFSILYFTMELRNWRVQLPDMLKQTEQTAEKISPAVSEVAEVAELIPPILEEVTKTREVIGLLLVEVKASRELVPDILEELPPVLQEVEKTREALPDIINPILVEVEKTRESMPEILKEVRETNRTIQKALIELQETRHQVPSIIENVEAIRQDLPAWLETVDNASNAVLKVTTEMEKLQPMIPEILEEVRKTREEMPVLLDEADRIVTSAKEIGAEAGKGAVSGVVKGVFSAPLGVMSDLGKTIQSGVRILGAEELTEKDSEIIRTKTLELIDSGREGKSLNWDNPESQNKGKVTLVKKYREQNQECRQVMLEIRIKGKKRQEVRVDMCQQPDGSWVEKK